MPLNPVRRAHLISPAGVGSLSVGKDGSTFITASLDDWFNDETASDNKVEIVTEEFKVEEWRMQKFLGVDYFMLPPDYRNPRYYGLEKVNVKMTIPAYRFPTWHVCQDCGFLKQFPLTCILKPKCPVCKKKGMTRYMSQVQIIAVCEDGHLQDFPWREWVHADDETQCDGHMNLSKSGASTFQFQIVTCQCGARRSLAHVMDVLPGRSSSFLSENLNRSPRQYLCKGSSPWMGPNQPEIICGRPLRVVLKNASNVYYADTKSAIYLPRGSENAPPELVELLQTPPLDDLIILLAQQGFESIRPQKLRLQQSMMLMPYTDEQIVAAIKIVADSFQKPQVKINLIEDYEDFDHDLLPLEYEQLKSPQNELYLNVSSLSLADYNSKVKPFFSTISLVKKLRETRVLVGFSRVTSNSQLSLEQKKKMMRKKPACRGENWLPASIVYGEGIFIEFNEERMADWEQKPIVQSRVRDLVKRYGLLEQARKWKHKFLSPRFIMIHTFAHVLLNQLTFECGYSAASLRERLYVSDLQGRQMSGLLIYTASGDSEGTLGGLVAMGRPGYLEAMIWTALEKAKWCSADPVCMEIGSSGGQGPESCNLAACHNCALVPETSCQEGNRFLDRALLIGDPVSGADIGFFM